MKFSDGFWLNQRGFNVNYAVMAYEITTTPNSITVFATSSAIYNRAMTLGGVTFEITYKSTAPDVIKVSVVHHKGTLKNADLGKVMLYQLSYFRVFSTGAKISSLLVSAKSFRRKV